MRRILLLPIIFALFLPCLAQKAVITKLDKQNGLAKKQITEVQKKEFIKLLKRLPHKGEFYTDEAVMRATPSLPVLFALTEKDINKNDLYSFVAISRGIFEQKQYRDYAVSNFAEIRHQDLKLFWAAMLFDEGADSNEIEQFLKQALDSQKRAKLLSDITGPNFEDLKRRIIAYPTNK